MYEGPGFVGNQIKITDHGKLTMNNYSSITPQGKFVYGIHKPRYCVANLRTGKNIEPLGSYKDGSQHSNAPNYPDGDIAVEEGGWIFEIPNPLHFRGATYIDKRHADAAAADYSRIPLPRQEELSLTTHLQQHNVPTDIIDSLPRPLLLTLATCSTDPDDLIRLAGLSCEFIFDDASSVTGLRYTTGNKGKTKARIKYHDLFEAVANNPALPDEYKKAMVLRPGAQGESEIVGEYQSGSSSHIYEYLRKNSYIAGGHFAANMADDAVRYSIAELTADDMQGLRHLYYQRMYVAISSHCGIAIVKRSLYSEEELEELRLQLLEKLTEESVPNLATLWGWNFGFDYSPTDYRLHASHQQIHQQYAVIPELVPAYCSDMESPEGYLPAFCCGDMIRRTMDEYQRHTQSDFFRNYFSAITGNTRMDKRSDAPSSLVVWQDDNVMVIVPKAQTSQWELQIMTRPDATGSFPGNILETDLSCRKSLDTALLKAQQIFEKLGAKMVTSIEFSKRIAEHGARRQPLVYSLLPKLPFSMGAFSEAQLRFINRHYPEDFAAVCRNQLDMMG